jgi:hypothetical protein
LPEAISQGPIKNCGYLPQEEHPEVTNDILLNFLKGRLKPWNDELIEFDRHLNKAAPFLQVVPTLN